MGTFFEDNAGATEIFTGLADRWAPVSNFAVDPAGWVENNGEGIWSAQREILESVRDNRYTAVHSAHDLGKSFIASRTIAWWIDSHPIGSAFVVSTAPTAAQVSAIMWREVGKIHKKAGLDGKINRAGYPQWLVDGELIGYGRKPADYEQSAFQGIHAQYVLVVVDEACGVARNLYDAVDALATNDHARVLAIGNPDDPSSHFATVCNPGSGWNVIHLDGLRSPNMTYKRVIGDDPDNPNFPLLAALMEIEQIPYSTEEVSDFLRDLLITERWIEERIERWCGVPRAQVEALDKVALGNLVKNRADGSSLFTAKVRGIFPTTSSEGIIPLGWVQRAMDRWHDLEQKNMETSEKAHIPGNLIVGVDVARTGNDETVLTIRYGSYVPEIHRMRITDTMEIVDRVAQYLHTPGSMAVIDVIGIGSGVYDRLRQMSNEGLIVGTVIPFNASAQSHRRDKLGQFQFRNDRAAAWWNMREMLDPAFGSMLALPDDEQLMEELIAPKFNLFTSGIMTAESKDDIKRRIGRSTDSADSVISSFWIQGSIGDIEMVTYEQEKGRAGVINWENYDPFTDADMAVSAGQSSMFNTPKPTGFGTADNGGWDL